MNAESRSPDPNPAASSHAHASPLAETAEGRSDGLGQSRPGEYGATEAPKENPR